MAAENSSIGRFMLDGILPAPRGVPQIEVSFDIDADGILKVSAKDQATNKEQHITIAGRSGLSDEEIERAVQEAEEHAEEDEKRRAAVEAKNMADSAVYAAEKLLSDQDEQIPDELKSEINEKIKGVKELLEDEATEADTLTAAVDELQRTLQKVGEAAYAAQAQGGAAPGGGDGGEAGPADGDGEPPEDTVDGEFREV